MVVSLLLLAISCCSAVHAESPRNERNWFCETSREVRAVMRRSAVSVSSLLPAMLRVQSLGRWARDCKAVQGS